MSSSNIKDPTLDDNRGPTMCVQVRLLPQLTCHPLFASVTQPHWPFWLPALQQWAEDGMRRLISEQIESGSNADDNDARVWLEFNRVLTEFPCCASSAARTWFGLNVVPDYVEIIPFEGSCKDVNRRNHSTPSLYPSLAASNHVAGIWLDRRKPYDIEVQVVFVGVDYETILNDREFWSSTANTRCQSPVANIHADEADITSQDFERLDLNEDDARQDISVISNQGTNIQSLAMDRYSSMGFQGFVAQQRRLDARHQLGKNTVRGGLPNDIANYHEAIADYYREEPLHTGDEDDEESASRRYTRPLSSPSDKTLLDQEAIVRTDHLMTILTCLFQVTDQLYPNSPNSVYMALRRYIIPYLVHRSLRSIHLLMLGLTTSVDEYEALDIQTLERTLQKLLIMPDHDRKSFHSVRGLFITNEDGMPWIGCQRAAKRLMMTWATAAPWLFYLHEISRSKFSRNSRQNTRSQVVTSEQEQEQTETVGGPVSPLRHDAQRPYYQSLQRRQASNQGHSSHDPKSTSEFPENLQLNDMYHRIALVPVTLTSFNSHQHLIASSEENVFYFVSSPSIQARSVRLPHIQSMAFQVPPVDYFLCYMMNQLFNQSLSVAYPRHKQEPVLRFLEDVRPCLIDRDSKKSCGVCQEQRAEWKSSFFGMSLMDCEKIFLHLYLQMIQQSKNIKESSTEDAKAYGDTLRPCFDHAFFWQHLRRIMHSKAVVSSLSPQAVSAFHFMRPQKILPEIESLVERIYESCWQQNQWVQFVQVIEPSAEYVKANGRLQINAKNWKPFLKSIQEKFSFNSHFHLSSPDQLLPQHPKHSAPYPHLMTNPFSVHRKKSLLLINNVESVTGFHKEVHVSFGDAVTKSMGAGKNHSLEHSWRRNLGADTGYTMHNRFAVAKSNTNSESAVAGTREGGSGNLGLGITGLSLGVGANKNWSTERAVGTTNVKERSVEFLEIPHLTFNGGLGYDDSFNQSNSASRSRAVTADESFAVRMTFEHPEALTKVIIGLKQHISKTLAMPKYKRKNRLILIFYQQPECFTELAVKRLGWSEDGTPPMQAAEGCGHHRSSVKQLMPCCLQWHFCQKCHQEQAESDACRNLRPADVSQIKCTSCSTIQHIQPNEHHQCIHGSCEQSFSAYHCVSCRLWTHLPVKHCDACQQCVGREFFPYHQQMCQRKKPEKN